MSILSVNTLAPAHLTTSSQRLSASCASALASATCLSSSSTRSHTVSARLICIKYFLEDPQKISFQTCVYHGLSAPIRGLQAGVRPRQLAGGEGESVRQPLPAVLKQPDLGTE